MEMKCPNCRKELTSADYEIYYDEHNNCTDYIIWCTNCGYNEYI